MSTPATEKEPFASWAILELMGHRRLGGYVTEQEIAGHGMLRIDVPGEDGQTTASQFYSPSSLYCLTPTTEEMARAVAKRNQPEPVARWEDRSPPSLGFSLFAILAGPLLLWVAFT